MSCKKIIKAVVSSGLKTRVSYYDLEKGEVALVEFQDEAEFKRLLGIGIFVQADKAALDAYQSQGIPVIYPEPQVVETVTSIVPEPEPESEEKESPEETEVPKEAKEESEKESKASTDTKTGHTPSKRRRGRGGRRKTYEVI